MCVCVYTYIVKWLLIKSINIPIASPTALCAFMVGMLKIYSLGIFQVYNILLLTIVTSCMLDLQKVCAFDQYSPWSIVSLVCLHKTQMKETQMTKVVILGFFSYLVSHVLISCFIFLDERLELL